MSSSFQLLVAEANLILQPLIDQVEGMCHTLIRFTFQLSQHLTSTPSSEDDQVSVGDDTNVLPALQEDAILPEIFGEVDLRHGQLLAGGRIDQGVLGHVQNSA